MKRPRFGAGLAALLAAWMLLACGGEEPRVLTASDAPFVVVLETTDLVVGDTRVVLTLLDRSDEPAFAAETAFRARFFEPTEGGIRFRAEAELERLELEGTAFYIARGVPLDNPGDWAVAVTASHTDGTSQSSPRVGFPVRAAAHRPLIGATAPTTPSASAADAPAEALSGDPAPLAALYARSTAELLAAGRPFLLLTASSERCAGRATCRRALEQAKEIARGGALAVVHVEPFGRPREPRLQAIIDAFNEAWGVRSEPAFWLIDEHGRVAAYLAVAVSSEELDEAIAALGRQQSSG